MKLYKIGSSEVFYECIINVDRKWRREVYGQRSCAKCAYLLNTQRSDPLDVVLTPDPDMRLGPIITTWGMDVLMIREDLIDDLHLTFVGGAFGDIYVGDERLPNYRSIVLSHDRWVFKFSLPLIAGSMRPCMSCGRLGLQSDMSDGTYVVYESMMAGSDIYQGMGRHMCITECALARIRPAIMKDLTAEEVTVVHLNHCKDRFV